MTAAQKTFKWFLAAVVGVTSVIGPSPSEAYSRTRIKKKKSQSYKVEYFKPQKPTKKVSKKAASDDSSDFLSSSEPDHSTAADVCVNCSRIAGLRTEPTKIEAAEVAQTAQTEDKPYTPISSSQNSDEFGNACLRKKLLESAKTTVRQLFRNRPYSIGKCALGVRTILNKSKISNTGSMGNAVTWHLGGHLQKQGFKNILRPGLTAYNAPPGAILVFRGPATNMSRADGGLPASKRSRRGRTAGYWVGHVTVKGDRPGQYYTDGLTEEPAVAGRALVAIYVPERCVNCTTEIKNSCGE